MIIVIILLIITTVVFAILYFTDLFKSRTKCKSKSKCPVQVTCPPLITCQTPSSSPAPATSVNENSKNDLNKLHDIVSSIDLKVSEGFGQVTIEIETKDPNVIAQELEEARIRDIKWKELKKRCRAFYKIADKYINGCTDKEVAKFKIKEAKDAKDAKDKRDECIDDLVDKCTEHKQCCTGRCNRYRQICTETTFKQGHAFSKLKPTQITSKFYMFGKDQNIINVALEVKKILKKSDFDTNLSKKEYLDMNKLRNFGKNMGMPYYDTLMELHFKKYKEDILDGYLDKLNDDSKNSIFIKSVKKANYINCINNKPCNNKRIIKSLIADLNFKFTYNSKLNELKTKYKNGNRLESNSSKIVLEYLLLNDNLENVLDVISDIILLFWVNIYSAMEFFNNENLAKTNDIVKQFIKEVPKRFSPFNMSIIETILLKVMFTFAFLKYETINAIDIKELDKFITFISSAQMPNLFTLQKEVVSNQIVLRISKLILTSGVYFTLNNNSKKSLKELLKKETNEYHNLFDKIDYYNLLKALLNNNLLDEFFKFLKNLQLSTKLTGLATKLDKIKEQFDKNVSEFNK